MSFNALFDTYVSKVNDSLPVAGRDPELRGGTHPLFAIFMDGERIAIFKTSTDDTPPPYSEAETYGALKNGGGPAREEAVQILARHLRECGIWAMPPGSKYLAMSVQRDNGVTEEFGTLVAFLRGTKTMDDMAMLPVSDGLFAPVVVVDFLIVNLDRNLGNILYSDDVAPEDAAVFPIDHCAGFPDLLSVSSGELRKICGRDFNPEFCDFRAFCAKPFEPSMANAITEFTEDSVIDRVAEEIKSECGLDSCFGKHGLTDTAILLFKICAAALRVYVERGLTIKGMVENMRGNFPEALSRVMGGKTISELGLTDREIVELFVDALKTTLG